MFTATSISRGILRVTMLLLPFVVFAMLVKPPQAEEVWSNDETQTVTTVLSHTQRGMLKPAEEASFQEGIELGISVDGSHSLSSPRRGNWRWRA